MLVTDESILDMILIAEAMELKTAIKMQSFQTIPEAIAQIPPSHVNRKLKEELKKTRNQEISLQYLEVIPPILFHVKQDRRNYGQGLKQANEGPRHINIPYESKTEPN